MTMTHLIDTLSKFVDESRIILADNSLSNSAQIDQIQAKAKSYGLWDDVTVQS